MHMAVVFGVLPVSWRFTSLVALVCDNANRLGTASLERVIEALEYARMVHKASHDSKLSKQPQIVVLGVALLDVVYARACPRSFLLVSLPYADTNETGSCASSCAMCDYIFSMSNLV